MPSLEKFVQKALLFGLIIILPPACKNNTREKSSKRDLAANIERTGGDEKVKEKSQKRKAEKKATGSKSPQGEKKESAQEKKRPSKYPSTRSMAPKKRANPVPGTEAFRDHFDQKGQQFWVDPPHDTTLRCNEGTLLHFPAHAFGSSSGEQVREKVKVTVKEYYENADILMAGLGTKSKERVLETGGMIHVEAEADGKACELRDGKSMKVEFPRKKGQKDMKLFSGERKMDGRMNWEVESGADLNRTYSEEGLEQKAMFPGGDTAKTLYIMEHTEYPASAQAQGKEGVVRIRVKIERSGELQNPELIDRANPSLNRAAFSMVKGMPSWIPAQKDGQRVKSRDTIEVKFQLSEAMKEEEAEEPMSAEEFENKMEGDGKIAEASTGEISNYLFSSTQMGWLNCDRFLDQLRTKEYVVKLKEKPEKSDVKLFLHEQRSFLKAGLQEEDHVFEQVPRNAEISVVVIQAASDGYKMAVKATNTRNENPELSFDQVTLKGLKSEMKRLNGI